MPTISLGGAPHLTSWGMARTAQIALLGAFLTGTAHWVGWNLATLLLPDFAVVSFATIP